MKKILDFFKTNKYAVIWTAAYIIVMWAVLRGMFNFNMFSTENWIRLAHAELRGFAGFVFGILILAAVPTYIVTTAIILRTKAPLFTIPIPKFLKRIPPQPEAQKTEQDITPPIPETVEAPLPTGLPRELRGAFLRARQHGCPPPVSTFNTNSVVDTTSNASTPTETIEPPATPQLQPVGDLPLPTDFDLTDGETDTIMSGDAILNTDAPVFKEISFDDTDSDQITNAPETQTSPDASSTSVIEYLTTHNHNIIETENDIIITDRIAIAVHDDADFWIADEETWFAAGKQKTSPAARLTAAAGGRNVRPVLYLAKTNIMDLDARRAKWEKDGITVITDLNQLPE